MTKGTPGQGALFKNDRKERDTHPDMTGTMLGHDGIEYWLNAWFNEYQDEQGQRRRYMSVRMKQKEAPKPQVAPPTEQPPSESFDDDIPF